MLARNDSAAHPARYATEEEKWTALERRDRAADGAFYCCVVTTGVYCRPSCPGRPKRENVVFHPTPEAARAAGFRACKRCRPDEAASRGEPGEVIAACIAALDFAALGRDLDAYGAATTGPLLTPQECTFLKAMYAQPEHFRSRIVMARHGFGRGEYQYFAAPLPPLVAALRAGLYPPLAEIANRWNEAMGFADRFPPGHAAFIERCHAAGQTRPTPLLLQYGAGGYNCLHQDVYGEHVFPLQVAFLLSRPNEDFTGGEFVLTEQRPRMQSRAEVVALKQGEGVIFPVRHRPVEGSRGVYRVSMRHGVSRIRSGARHTLGLIFHDGK